MVPLNHKRTTSSLAPPIFGRKKRDKNPFRGKRNKNLFWAKKGEKSLIFAKPKKALI